MGELINIHASTLSKDILTGGTYVLQGTDAFWQKQAEKIFCSLLSSDSLSLRYIDTVSDVQEIISSFGTLNFTDEITVMLVRDNETTLDAKQHSLLQKFLAEPIAPDILVFCNSNLLTSAEIKLCNVISCSPLDKSEGIKQAQKLFPNGIEPNALRLLGELTAYDMSKIYSESQKLNAYTSGKVVSESDVEDLVVEDTETSVFLFSNNIVDNQLLKAERQIDKLIKRGEKPALLLSVLANQFRRMLFCSITPLSDKELADILGIKEFAVKKTREIKGYSPTKLKSCVSMLSDCEYKFKSGVYSEDTAFKIAISKLLCKEVI